MRTEFIFALLSVGIIPGLNIATNAEPIFGRANCKTVNHRCKASLSGWKKVKSLVTFGDSYTDESRLNYFGSNGGPPPIGWEAPANNVTGSGGKSWARIVAEQANVKLYNYAVSGAVCSNLHTPRTFESIKAPFPDIEQYELPTYLAEHVNGKTGKLGLDPSETVYTIWIGTNDLGGNAYLSDEHLPGITLADYTKCVFKQVKDLYEKAGARYFMLHNNVPLDKSPLYNSGTKDGFVYIGNNRFWANKDDQFAGNGTKIEEKIKQEVTTTNEVLKYRAIAAVLGNELPSANIALFDTHALLSDIYANPSAYLTGPAPLNVTGHNVHCRTSTWDDCYTYRPDDRDSFLWYDELHPSEISWKVVAGEVVKVFKGKNSKFITIFG